MESFEKIIIEGLKNILTGAEVSIKHFDKLDQKGCTAVTIRENDMNIAPLIYLDFYYNEWMHGKEISDICTEIVNVYNENRILKNINVSELFDYERVISRICFKMVNYEFNKKVWADVPHIKFGDMAIVFFIRLNDFASVLIRNTLLNMWDIDKTELLLKAKHNTPKIYKESFMSIMDVMKELVTNVNSTSGMHTVPYAILNMDMQLYVLTNNEKTNGAVTMFYDGLLENIGKKLESDFYIIPSSVHEVLILPAINRAELEVEKLKEIVSEVNDTIVSEEDILSYDVFYYSREAKRIIV